MLDLITQFLPYIISALALIFGAKWLQISNKIRKFAKVAKEGSDVIDEAGELAGLIDKHLEDNKYDPEEVQELVAKIGDIRKEWGEFKKLLL